MTARPTTSLKLDARIKERVDRLAAARQRSAHWLMRQPIEDCLEREEQREQLRQDALAAWDDYEATGQHVTAEEAEAWLAPQTWTENAQTFANRVSRPLSSG